MILEEVDLDNDGWLDDEALDVDERGLLFLTDTILAVQTHCDY